MLLFKSKVSWKLSFDDESLTKVQCDSKKTHGMVLKSLLASFTSDFKICIWGCVLGWFVNMMRLASDLLLLNGKKLLLKKRHHQV